MIDEKNGVYLAQIPENIKVLVCFRLPLEPNRDFSKFHKEDIRFASFQIGGEIMIVDHAKKRFENRNQFRSNLKKMKQQFYGQRLLSLVEMAVDVKY